jgi:predicted Zn-dependent protease
MRSQIFTTFATSLIVFGAGCANSPLSDLGASVISQTGYVSESQAKGLFSVGDKLAKSQESLTPEQEYYLGRAVSAKLLASYPPKLDAGKTKYLNEIGMSLVAVSDMPETFGGYHFAVIDSPTINAMSAPGGFIYVSSGFIKLLPDEDSLAAVLAHEIGHEVHQDGVNAISNAALFSALSEASAQGASIAMSQVSSPVDLGAITSVFSQSVEGVTEKLLTKGFDRSQEYKADLYAANLLQKAGYNPKALIGVLKILQDHSSSDNGGWFATHPNPADRIAELEDDYTFADASQTLPARTARFRQVFAR